MNFVQLKTFEAPKADDKGLIFKSRNVHIELQNK